MRKQRGRRGQPWRTLDECAIGGSTAPLALHLLRLLAAARWASPAGRRPPACRPPVARRIHSPRRPAAHAPRAPTAAVGAFLVRSALTSRLHSNRGSLPSGRGPALARTRTSQHAAAIRSLHAYLNEPPACLGARAQEMRHFRRRLCTASLALGRSRCTIRSRAQHSAADPRASHA
jgi:hypothetical protein